MTDRIPIGALACSAIGTRSVIPAILESERFKLEYIASRDPEKARYYASKFGCRPSTYDGLLAADDITAVYVSLPVGLHYEWGKKVVASGKHLLMEKTFTHDHGSAREILRLAQDNQVVAMEALAYVYHPLFKTVVRCLESNAIGQIRAIQAQFGFPKLPSDNIRNQRALAGGALTDALVYPLSFALNLVGRPPNSGHAHLVCSETYGVDARGSVQLNWSSHCSAQLTYGFGMEYRNSYTVWGETGYLMADRVFSRPPELRAEVVIVSRGAEKRIDVGAANHFLNMLAAFSGKIDGSSTSDLNEADNILERMGIIGRFRNAFLSQGETDVEI